MKQHDANLRAMVAEEIRLGMSEYEGQLIERAARIAEKREWRKGLQRNQRTYILRNMEDNISKRLLAERIFDEVNIPTTQSIETIR